MINGLNTIRKDNSWVFYPTIILGFLLGFEGMSFLSTRFLGIYTPVLPWSFWILLSSGFFGFFWPVLIAFILVGLLLASATGWFLGGLERAISIYIFYALCGFLIANWIAVIVYMVWRGLSMTPYPWLAYKLFITDRGNRFGICLITGYSVLLLIPVFRFFSLKEKAKRVLGQAHFAGIWEARSLFTKKGIVLGKAFGRILRLPGDESVLLTAPTGSGKTAGIAIPNLIEWTDSVVVNDLKGELFSKTADLRRHTHQQPVFRFAPADETQNTHGYNPFFYVRKEPNLIIRDLQLIAEILIPDERLGDGFWHKSSREIFVLLSLYLQETNGVATLGDVYVLGRQAHFLQWLQLAVLEGKVKNPVFYHYATSLLEADERTRHNILKDFHSRISLLADPLIVHATQKNDFDFRELRKKAMSIYIHIPDADVSRLKPLLTLFWAQLIYELSKQEPDLKKEPYRVLALLDEFGHLGKMDVLKSITFLRSYRMRFVLMVQHLGQIVSVYGREEAKNFLNAKVRMAFALNDDDDAKLFASDLGTKTVSVLSNSNHSGRRDGSSSQSRSFRSRELMMKDELKKLHKKQEIILIESMNPIKAKKCLWFKERRYRDFLKQYREGICKSDI